MKFSILNTQLVSNPRHALGCAALFAALLLIRFARWLFLPRPDLLNFAATSAAPRPAVRRRLDIAFFEGPEMEIMIADQLVRTH
jgi:hypothetical protein